jgi:cation transport protein ChaC
MWKPGFDFDDVSPARLHGAHRSLCIYSINHRGTKRFPGLVFGLDVGGVCDGLAFHVPESKRLATASYLRLREQVTNVYTQAMRPVTLTNYARQTVYALTYLVNRRHRQYAGELPVSVQANIVRRAQGKSGRNLEYVINTLLHLRELGIEDPHLNRLAAVLGRKRLAASRVALKNDIAERYLSKAKTYLTGEGLENE